MRVVKVLYEWGKNSLKRIEIYDGRKASNKGEKGKWKRHLKRKFWSAWPE